MEKGRSKHSDHSVGWLQILFQQTKESNEIIQMVFGLVADTFRQGQDQYGLTFVTCTVKDEHAVTRFELIH